MNSDRSFDLRRDVPASLVVFFVAVPLCLGIALASLPSEVFPDGVPLASGLIAGIIGGLVVGAISGSPLGVSGPAAGLAVIVYTAIEDLGSFEVFLVAVVIAGVLQVLLGLLRAGVIAYFFPAAVIKGMLAGIGIIIVLKQIPHALGHDTDPEGSVTFAQPDGENTMSSLQAMFGDFTAGAIVVSLSCLAILILWERVLAPRARIFKLIQGPLVAVAFGIGYQLITSRVAPDWALKGDHLVNVPVSGGFSGLTKLLTYPDFSQIANPAVWVTGITIAVVASLETLLCVEATDKLDPEKRVTPTNRELVAQGVGNAASGLIGGLPVTQVIVRSSANIQSGGNSKLSAILHGGFLLIAVALFPQILNLVPLAALAAILLVVGYKLARPVLFQQMWSKGLGQFLPFTTTILGIVFIDLLNGIGIGLAVAVVMLLRSHFLNSHCLHMQESDDEEGRKHVRIEFAEEVTFLNKGAILRELNEITPGSVVTIDASRSVFVDEDVLEIISDFEEGAVAKGIEVRRDGHLSSTLRLRQPSPGAVA